MKVLDTNTLTHFFAGRQLVLEAYQREIEEIAATVISFCQVPDLKIENWAD